MMNSGHKQKMNMKMEHGMNIKDEVSQQKFEEWAVIELFGRQQVAGKVTEQVIAGQGFIRVDVPGFQGLEPYTRLFGPGAIYSIIPTTEAIVIAFIVNNYREPILPYQVRVDMLSNAMPRKEFNGEMEDENGEDED